MEESQRMVFRNPATYVFSSTEAISSNRNT